MYIVTINDKPWTRAKEVCKVLEYKKDRAIDVLKMHVSIENKRHRNEIEWPKNSQPDNYYINEEGMYEVLFSSQQPKVKGFRRYCYNVCCDRFDRRLLKKKLQQLHCLMVIYKIVNKRMQHYRLKEMLIKLNYKDVKIPLLILKKRFVDNAKDSGKDNIIMINEKNTTPEEDEYYEYPYNSAKMQR